MKVALAIVIPLLWPVALGVVAACEKTEHVCVYPLPPPILSGKCIGEQYVGSIPTKQACAYEGFTWSCTWHAVGNLYLCDRAERLPPLTAEKPLPTK